MPDLKLTFACGLYDRMLALYTGDVKPERIDLQFQVEDSPRVIFDRMAGGLAFDMAEFSASEYISQRGRGDCPFVALPVFPSKLFRHGFICINTKKGITAPANLAGKRIGVPLYTMTAAVFNRGLLTGELTLGNWRNGDSRQKYARFQDDTLETNLALMSVMRDMAADYRATLPQLALAWVLAKGGPIVPFLGCKSRDHLEENLKSLEIKLSADDVATLDEAYPLGVAAGARYAEKQLAFWHQ